MIVVVDYGMGNLRNVRRALEQFRVDVEVTNDASRIRSADKVVLPGVGAFGEAVRRIDGLGVRPTILEFVASGKPLLGICLGMQLLFEGSEESPGARGLGILKGDVRKFPAGVKVPHIGWNDILPQREGKLIGREDAGACYYFVHSFYAPETSATVARSIYGGEFTAAVEQDNVFGTQFHPEKSQKSGKNLLERFVRLS